MLKRFANNEQCKYIVTEPNGSGFHPDVDQVKMGRTEVSIAKILQEISIGIFCKNRMRSDDFKPGAISHTRMQRREG